MKIQSVQNQPIQNNPTFSARGVFKPNAPKIYQGINSIEDDIIPLANSKINLILQKLHEFIKVIVPVLKSEETVKRFSRRHDYVREFSLGEDKIILTGRPESDLPSIYLMHPNGETQIDRYDRRGIIDKNTNDPYFDTFANALDAKPPAVGSFEEDVDRVMDKIFRPVLKKRE